MPHGSNRPCQFLSLINVGVARFSCPNQILAQVHVIVPGSVARLDRLVLRIRLFIMRREHFGTNLALILSALEVSGREITETAVRAARFVFSVVKTSRM